MALRRSAGFTLIELMVTIAIGAILLSLAYPSFTASMRANRVTAATNQMLATLNFARGEALRSKSTARICPNANGACGSNWSGGLLVWTDENGDNAFSANEVKRVIEPLGSIDLDIRNIDAISFDERGRVPRDRPTGYAFALQAHECKPGVKNRRGFSINRIGRVVVTKDTCQ